MAANLEEVGQHALIETQYSFGAYDGGDGMGSTTVGEAVTHGTLHLHAPSDHVQGVADCTKMCFIKVVGLWWCLDLLTGLGSGP